MNIAQYLEHTGMSPETFGEIIGVHGVTVRRWLEGQEIKSGDMDTMIRKTHGKITAEALLGSNSGKSKRTA